MLIIKLGALSNWNPSLRQLVKHSTSNRGWWQPELVVVVVRFESVDAAAAAAALTARLLSYLCQHVSGKFMAYEDIRVSSD